MHFSAPTANICSVLFHLFGHASHELAARVNLQHPGPSWGAALVDRLKSFSNLSRVLRCKWLSFIVAPGEVYNGQRVFVNFSATEQVIMWFKKDGRLDGPK